MLKTRAPGAKTFLQVWLWHDNAAVARLRDFSECSNDILILKALQNLYFRHIFRYLMGGSREIALLQRIDGLLPGACKCYGRKKITIVAHVFFYLDTKLLYAGQRFLAIFV